MPYLSYWVCMTYSIYGVLNIKLKRQSLIYSELMYTFEKQKYMYPLTRYVVSQYPPPHRDDCPTVSVYGCYV